MEKKERGITLISLVLTIIVMLILVAVSINIAINGGLFKKAGEAVKNTEEERDKELTLAEGMLNIDNKTYALIDDYLAGNEYIAQYDEVKKDTNGLLTANAKYKGEGDTTEAVIPKGFKVSTTPGENTINGGLVIQDVNKNEFVWVPVPEISDFYRSNWEADATTGGTRRASLTDSAIYTEPYADGYTTEQAEYDLMKASVEEYKGFYIGRYEAGKGVHDELVVQKNKPVYNSITWGTGMKTIGTNGAVYLSQHILDNNNENKTGAVSTLCYGIMWDSALNFIVDVDPTYPTDSTSKGNYTRSLACTGSDEVYNFKNIYDMAGNIWEWTMESYIMNDCSYRVARGGCFGYGSAYPAGSRFYYNAGYDDIWHFRTPCGTLRKTVKFYVID